MAGHSKWAQIKRQKSVADQRRGAVFAKLANAITVAARNGADPEMNFQLRIAIERAKAANMPKENIERAINRVRSQGGAVLEEILFEAYGPGATAFLIKAATDNRNRTVSEIRAVLNKHDGKLAESGSVGYLFKKRGQIVLDKVNVQEAELAAIDAGAEDLEPTETGLIVYTNPKALDAVRHNLAKAGFNSTDLSIEYTPLMTVPVTDPTLAQKVIKLYEALDDLDDVVSVSSNFDVDEDLLTQ